MRTFLFIVGGDCCEPDREAIIIYFPSILFYLTDISSLMGFTCKPLRRMECGCVLSIEYISFLPDRYNLYGTVAYSLYACSLYRLYHISRRMAHVRARSNLPRRRVYKLESQSTERAFAFSISPRTPDFESCLHQSQSFQVQSSALHPETRTCQYLWYLCSSPSLPDVISDR